MIYFDSDSNIINIGDAVIGVAPCDTRDAYIGMTGIVSHIEDPSNRIPIGVQWNHHWNSDIDKQVQKLWYCEPSSLKVIKSKKEPIELLDEMIVKLEKGEIYSHE